MIESYRRNKTKQLKEKISMQFLLASLIEEHIANQFNEHPTDTRKPWDIYPDLFVNEQIAYKKQMEIEELEHFKALRYRYAAEHNL